LRLLQAYDRVVLAHPKLILTGILALIGLSAWWVQDFRLDASSDSLVLENDDDLRFSREVARRYKDEEFLVVTVTPKSGDLFSAESRALLTEMRADLRKIERVSSITTLLDVPLARTPPVPLTELQKNLKTLEEIGEDAELLAFAREEFRTSPVFRELIISEDLRSTAVQIKFRNDPKYVELARRRADLRLERAKGNLSAEQGRELALLDAEYVVVKDALLAGRTEDIATIRSIIDKYRDRADLRFGGVPMVVDDIVSFIKNDLVVFGVGMLAFLIGTLWVVFRRWRWVALPILSCATSGFVMMGMVGLVGWEVTVVSSNFISLQLIFTMSLTIHLVVRYRELAGIQPDASQRELVSDTVGKTFVPCLYASLTTIAGFSSLVFCDIFPVVAFGRMMTLGIGVSLAMTFLLFPAILVLLKKLPPKETKEFGRWLTSRFARWTEKRGRSIFSVSILVAIATGIGASRLEVENSFLEYFKKSTEIYQGMAFVDRELGGTTPLDVVLEFGEKPPEEPTPEEPTAPDGDGESGEDEDDFGEFDEFDEFDEEDDAEDKEKYWFTATKLERIEKIHDYLDSQSAVGKVLSLSTLAKLGKEINEGETLDDLLLAILFQKMPEEFKTAMVSPYASVDHDQARVSVRIRDSDKSLRRNALLQQIHENLTTKLGLKEDQFRLSGLTVLYNNMLQSLFRSQIQTIGFTVLALFVMFLILFRSLLIALIAIFPSLLSSLVVLGVMGLAGIPLDVMTITIVAISVGIAVDDTIHYIHRFQKELAVDGNYVATMGRCHNSIGNAMFYTTITIAVGFSILCLSSFIPSILFGSLTALAMAMALVSALSLLPRLLIVVKPFRVAQKDSEAAQETVNAGSS